MWTTRGGRERRSLSGEHVGAAWRGRTEAGQDPHGPWHPCFPAALQLPPLRVAADSAGGRGAARPLEHDGRPVFHPGPGGMGSPRLAVLLSCSVTPSTSCPSSARPPAPPPSLTTCTCPSVSGSASRSTHSTDMPRRRQDTHTPPHPSSSCHVLLRVAERERCCSITYAPTSWFWRCPAGVEPAVLVNQGDADPLSASARPGRSVSAALTCTHGRPAGGAQASPALSARSWARAALRRAVLGHANGPSLLPSAGP